VQNEIACGFGAQSLIASTSLLSPGDYMKIVCQRRSRQAGESDRKAEAENR
jgi:hypothetical protein